MTVVLIIVGLLFALAGIIGCLLPVIPGPALSFLSLMILSYAREWAAFSPTFLVVMGILAIIVSILDYVVPASGAKKFGASKWGVSGSLGGMLIGTGLKLAFTGIILFFYLKEIIGV